MNDVFLLVAVATAVGMPAIYVVVRSILEILDKTNENH
jgi:hypothetical protein